MQFFLLEFAYKNSLSLSLRMLQALFLELFLPDNKSYNRVYSKYLQTTNLVGLIMRFLYVWIENVVEKGGNTCHRYVFFFSQDVFKSRILQDFENNDIV